MSDPRPDERPPLTKATAGAVLLGTCGRIILQQRDDIPGIDNPGLIGLFGGHLEPGEGFRDCVAREIAEETGHHRPPSDYELLSDIRFHDPSRGEIAAVGFLLRDVPTDELVITEGAMVALSQRDIADVWTRLTPTTLFAVRHAIDRL